MYKRIYNVKAMSRPTAAYENEIRSQGYSFIAGIDEVGRGAIAGPVAAAAVILPYPIDMPWVEMVRDSKELSPSRRQLLSPMIENSAVSSSVGMVSSTQVDRLGIANATRLAMMIAIKQLSRAADFLIIDALSLPDVPIPQRTIIHGDRLSVSIAAASIVAKVRRDQHMIEIDHMYPGYGLAAHKGYGTKQHLASLQKLGPCHIHRQTFAPIKQRHREH